MDERKADSEKRAVERGNINEPPQKCSRLESIEHNVEPQIMNISDFPVELRVCCP